MAQLRVSQRNQAAQDLCLLQEIKSVLRVPSPGQHSACPTVLREVPTCIVLKGFVFSSTHNNGPVQWANLLHAPHAIMNYA